MTPEDTLLLISTLIVSLRISTYEAGAILILALLAAVFNGNKLKNGTFVSYRSESMGLMLGVIILPLVSAAKLSAGCETAEQRFWETIACGMMIVLRAAVGSRNFPVDMLIIPAITALFDTYLAVLLLIFNLYLIVCLCFLARSFTLGEAVVLSEGLALISLDAIYGFKNASDVYVIIVGLILGSLVTGILVFPVLWKLWKEKDSAKAPWAAALHLCMFAVIIALVDPFITSIIGVDPFIWGIKLVAKTPFVAIGLIIWWCFVLFVGLQIAHLPFIQTIPTVVRRKLYHVLVVIMFVPGTALAPKIQAVAMAIATAMFIFIEYFRVTRTPPFGDSIDSFMRSFTDDRDKGHLILTHVYLLLGCAVPLWLGDGGGFAVYAGVISVIFCGLCIMFTLPPYISLNWTLYDYLAYLIATIMAMLLESFTEQIDNLFLPLFYFVGLTLH